MLLSESLARWYGANVDEVAWQDTGAYPADVWGLYCEQLPQGPDRAVAVFEDSGPEPDSLLPYLTARVQTRVRADLDPRTSYAVAESIWSALHGLTAVELPGGVWLTLAVCTTVPVRSAPDESGRWQWSIPADLEILRPSLHRPE